MYAHVCLWMHHVDTHSQYYSAYISLQLVQLSTSIYKLCIHALSPCNWLSHVSLANSGKLRLTSAD